MASLTGLGILIKNIYSIGSQTRPSTCYILFNEHNIPFYHAS